VARPRPSNDLAAAEVRAERGASGELCIVLGGRLDSRTTAAAWREAMRLREAASERRLVVDVSGIVYCDGAGASLIGALEDAQRAAGGEVELVGASEALRGLLELLAPKPAEGEAPRAREASLVAQIGRAALEQTAGLRSAIVFTGELVVALARAARAPRRVRWKDALLVAERAGNGALPIVLLVGFLLGLILSFQSAIPMRRFGAEIFVADLLGIAMLRELGPLMASILLTARSGSAFAAEIGTMKVNEEVDALRTMGLEPVSFLVVPRVVAAVACVPVLTVFLNLAALVGGAVVMRALGIPLVTFVNHVTAAATVADMTGGLAKALAFGLIVAAVGCLRGLGTQAGAGAVGESTTSAVVSGIVLIAVADGVFAVIFWVLGW
jgi:phospholipid/cholesterol/gamma-HCH transport system permease protein